MRVAKANHDFARTGRKQNGFSILEMILASAILMVGIVSVVQLVPASLKSSVGNRMDTMATVVCQRELDQMLSQPLNVNAFLDMNSQTISLGGAGSPGASVLMSGQSVVIDFSPGTTPPAGFSATMLTDPNNLTSASFELRWAVFPQLNNGVVAGRRIVIGCRRANGGGDQQLLLPVTLDSSVQK
jgi:type II secretory pathway pseudopilin PulG